MMSTITRRSLHSIHSSVFGRSSIRKALINRNNKEKSCDTKFDTGTEKIQKLETRNKIADQTGETLAYIKNLLKNISIEAPNDVLQPKNGMIDASKKNTVDVRVFYYFVDQFRQLVRNEVGPYLSLKVEDFNTTPSPTLYLYWSDKSLGQLTKKIKEHESNQLLRDILERKGMPMEELLCACEGMLEGERSGFSNLSS